MTAILRFFLTVFLVVLIPTYYNVYGPQNFLWMSDIALFLIVIGLWTRSSLYMSMAAVLTLFLEVFWTIDYFYNLSTGVNLFDIAGYMFDEQYSIFIRGLSLFHLLLPILSLGYMKVWGYHNKALFYSILVLWVNLIICYNFTPASENINWVHHPEVYSYTSVGSYTWLAMQLFLYPLLVMLPMSVVFRKVFPYKSETFHRF